MSQLNYYAQYDFETVNDYDFQDAKFESLSKTQKENIIATQTLPLEVSLVLTKDLLKYRCKKIKIIFPLKYDDCSQYQKEGLHFNNINSQTDIDEHNVDAYDISKAMKFFVIILKQFYQAAISNFTLIGFNNSNFDDLILRHFLLIYTNDCFLIMRQVKDLYQFINDINVKQKLTVSDRFKYFNFPSDSSLINVYETLFKKSFHAHDSLEDSIALSCIIKKFADKCSYVFYEYFSESFKDFIISSIYSDVEKGIYKKW